MPQIPRIAATPPRIGQPLPRVARPGDAPTNPGHLTAAPPSAPQKPPGWLDPPPSPEVLAKAVAEALGPAIAIVVQALDRLSDDLYNNAVLTNPTAFVAGRTKETTKSVSATDASTGVSLYRNASNDTVVLYARADNSPTDDVVALLLSYQRMGLAEAQIDGAITNGKAAAVVLRPGQEVFVNVKAITYPANVHFTVVPLRGRATVFGG